MNFKFTQFSRSNLTTNILNVESDFLVKCQKICRLITEASLRTIMLKLESLGLMLA